ncbi:lactate utilization protein C [Peribacillus cavernae]|uniref:Lactate utilization protein C n=1 Tax=Peribacillus cavernae TaxID=1674310 RepID=A0A3S0U518_9BACI|nr:lactate utilization protein C [Peribacillus cavernae]MDQ0217295.1 L-lactate dehydrogenase complex protein LldG [Peribacillus cavernae]RUQ30239.1 lactate utilization protein C [Peribacillus cavernae]
MMAGTIQNRASFLDNIAKQLGRERVTEIKRPEWKFQPQHEVLKDASKEELILVLKDHCTRIHTDFYQTSSGQLADTLKFVVDDLGGGPVIIPKDSRFDEYGLTELVTLKWPSADIPVHEWNHEIGRENIAFAEQSNVGITFSEITLAESGTVVLFSDKDRGRSVSLLPTAHVTIIPKSTIVPRMTQAAQIISAKVQKGEVLPSCINYITGPSNSADIEMDLVVGVHGPVKAAYIVVDDE